MGGLGDRVAEQTRLDGRREDQEVPILAQHTEQTWCSTQPAGAGVAPAWDRRAPVERWQGEPAPLDYTAHRTDLSYRPTFATLVGFDCQHLPLKAHVAPLSRSENQRVLPVRKRIRGASARLCASF